MKIICLFITTIFSLQLLAQDIPKIDWDALQATKPWVRTEVWEPEPIQIKSASGNQAPSDATILFDGRNLDAWQKPQFKNEMANIEQLSAMFEVPKTTSYADANWHVESGYYFQVVPGTGAIETKQHFGDMQLHIEWLSPVDEGKEGQAYSNSGLFLMGIYEVQILNSHKNRTYANGQAGAVYKQYPPLVNASNPAGEWQSYDVIFKAPEFAENGDLVSPAYLTVLHNGVLIQNHVELKGPTLYIGDTHYLTHASKGPIRLQDHGDAVRFRNVWVRAL